MKQFLLRVIGVVISSAGLVQLGMAAPFVLEDDYQPTLIMRRKMFIRMANV